MKIRHLLTDKDTSARTASCSVCGPVEIRPVNGGRSWICLNKKRASADEWREANPERTAEGRRRVSEHHLSEYSLTTRQGECPVCGPVAIVPFGRGYACANRAAELRSSVQEELVRCSICGHQTSEDNPVVDGACGFHRGRNWGTRELAHGMGTFFRYDETIEQAISVVAQGGYTGSHQGYEQRAAQMRNTEKAVPGWKTLGEPIGAAEWEKWNNRLAAEGL